ncbi:hypothetical protein AD998_05535 [bacterium 336/3]|nr:hypothetical protein AD998_05535 [bacterium 336/3]
MRYIFLFFVVSIMVSCSNSKQKDSKKTEEKAVKYTPKIKDFEKPIIPKADSAFLGQIQFLKNDAISIVLPDSTVIIAKQSNTTTRKYQIAKDSFLIFSTKNYAKGYKIFSNDNRALWAVKMGSESIEITQENFDRNLFEIRVQKDELLVRHKNIELGKATLKENKVVFTKKGKKLFEIDSDVLLPAYGILLIEEIGIEERYALFAETLARGY